MPPEVDEDVTWPFVSFETVTVVTSGASPASPDLRVSPTTNSARQAVARTFGFADPNQYALAIQS